LPIAWQDAQPRFSNARRPAATRESTTDVAADSGADPIGALRSQANTADSATTAIAVAAASQRARTSRRIVHTQSKISE
jgi:hypothetical protein